jgi:shikimate dehydrogenase
VSRIAGSTAVYGVLGFPVAHSRSPAMHNAAFEALGLDAAYVPFPVERGRLAQAARGLPALGIRGANVTVPHKESVLELLDETDVEAGAIGAVNTLVIEDGRLLGFNTDAPGLVRSLQSAGVSLTGAHVTVVGAGGAARAAVVGLARAVVSKITIAARRPERAREMLHELAPALGHVHTTACGLGDELQETLSESSLLVQATSATLDDGPEAQQLAASLPFDALPRHATVTDLVYKPRRTAVIRGAESRGLHTVDGLGMLLYQGVLAFERWTGRSAPVDVMWDALTRP